MASSRVVASYHPTSATAITRKMYARMLFCFTTKRKSALRPRGGSIDVLCPLSLPPMPHSDAISFSEFFIFLQELFFHLCLIIWLLDVQHRLGRAHISQHDDWVTHNLFSFSIAWRYVPGEGDGTSGLRVCVLNFYDFIIPYFKPFVHCSSLHL